MECSTSTGCVALKFTTLQSTKGSQARLGSLSTQHGGRENETTPLNTPTEIKTPQWLLYTRSGSPVNLTPDLLAPFVSQFGVALQVALQEL